MYKKIVTICLAIGLIILLLNWNSLNLHYKPVKSQSVIDYFDKNKIIELIKQAQITTTTVKIFKNVIDRANVKIFDLSKELEPVNIYNGIKCRKSAKFIVETTLCIHPLEKDIWVSSSIWNHGVWEGDIVCKVFILYSN